MSTFPDFWSRNVLMWSLKIYYSFQIENFNESFHDYSSKKYLQKPVSYFNNIILICYQSSMNEQFSRENLILQKLWFKIGILQNYSFH